MSAETKLILEAAQATLRQIERERRRDIELAEREVQERYAEAIRVAEDAVNAATQAHTASEDTAAAHPWEGKRVYRMERKYAGMWGRAPETIRVEGIFEVYRSTTPTPTGMPHYRKPVIGQSIVRLALKDGKPGKKFERVPPHSPNNDGWMLVEEEKVNDHDPV